MTAGTKLKARRREERKRRQRLRKQQREAAQKPGNKVRTRPKIRL